MSEGFVSVRVLILKLLRHTMTNQTVGWGWMITHSFQIMMISKQDAAVKQWKTEQN